jgi:hypothetical protein
MDWATDSALRIARRWGAIFLGLATCAAHFGCAGMNPFLRDEPPLLGATTATAARSSRPSVPSAGAPGSRSRNDLYAQSFNRTRPRPGADTGPSPAAAESSRDQADPPQEASTFDRARSDEKEVEKTALAPPVQEAPSPSGVTLRPPVALRRAADTTPRVAQSDPGPAELPAPTLESLVAVARERVESFHSYQVALNRQERMGAILQDPEEVILSIRRNPRAVRLHWPRGPHQGREVLFSEQETKGLMEVNSPGTLIPIPRIALAPDSPLALRSGRHPITEAGFETVLAKLTKTIEENKAGDTTHGRISYAGLAQPESLDHPCHKILRVTATGEVWQIFLDPETKLPALVQANAPTGELLECYVFHEVEPDPSELASEDAFDPNRRWGEPKGLVSRLAGGVLNTGNEPPSTTTR